MHNDPLPPSPEAERWLDLAIIEIRHLTDEGFDGMLMAWALMMALEATDDELQ